MSASVVAAIKTKYATLNPAFWPAGVLYRFDFGEMAKTDSAGAQVIPVPGAVFKVDTFTPRFQSDTGGMQVGTMTVTLYEFEVDDLAVAVRAFKYNGQRPFNRAGFDYGSLTLAAPEYNIDMIRSSEQTMFVSEDRAGIRTHATTLVYKLMVGIDANQTPAAP